MRASRQDRPPERWHHSIWRSACLRLAVEVAATAVAAAKGLGCGGHRGGEAGQGGAGEKNLLHRSSSFQDIAITSMAHGWR